MDYRQSNENSTDNSEDESNRLPSGNNEPEAKVTKVSPKKSPLGSIQRCSNQNIEPVFNIRNTSSPDQDYQQLTDCVSDCVCSEQSTSSGRRYPNSDVGDGACSHKSYVKKSSHPSGGNYSDYRSPLKSQKQPSPSQRSPPTLSGATEKYKPPPPRFVKSPPPALPSRMPPNLQRPLTRTLSSVNPESNLPPPLLIRSSLHTRGCSPQIPHQSPGEPQLYSEITLTQSTESKPPPVPPRAPRFFSPDQFLPPEQDTVAGGSELPYSGISQTSGQSVRPKVQKKTQVGSMEGRSGPPIHQTEGDGSDKESEFSETSSSGSNSTVRTQIERNVQYVNVCKDRIPSNSSGASTSCSSMVGESNFPSLQSLESSPSLSSENHMAGDLSRNQDISEPSGACGLNNCCSTGQSCDSEGNCSAKCLSCSIDGCRTHCKNHCIIHCSLHDCTSLLGTLCTSASTSPSTLV